MIEFARVQQLKSVLFSVPERTVFVLLDGASVPELLQRLASYRPLHVCLFGEKVQPEIAEVAPYLAILELESPFTEWVLSNCWGKHWGVFGTATVDLPALTKHFRRMLIVYDESWKGMYFRFYDPRVWRMFLPACASAELRTFTGPVTSFVLEDDDPSCVRRFTCSDGALLDERVRLDEAYVPCDLATVPAKAEIPSVDSGGAVRISAERVEDMDRLHFYAQVRSFVVRCCRDEKLLRWVSDRSKRTSWDRVWPQVRYLSEHDCALALVHVAVCECEGIRLGPQDWLAGDFEAREVGIKDFLAEKGYFRFSDFEFP